MNEFFLVAAYKKLHPIHKKSHPPNSHVDHVAKKTKISAVETVVPPSSFQSSYSALSFIGDDRLVYLNKSAHFLILNTKTKNSELNEDSKSMNYFSHICLTDSIVQFTYGSNLYLYKVGAQWQDLSFPEPRFSIKTGVESLTAFGKHAKAFQNTIFMITKEQELIQIDFHNSTELKSPLSPTVIDQKSIDLDIHKNEIVCFNQKSVKLYQICKPFTAPIVKLVQEKNITHQQDSQPDFNTVGLSDRSLVFSSYSDIKVMHTLYLYHRRALTPLHFLELQAADCQAQNISKIYVIHSLKMLQVRGVDLCLAVCFLRFVHLVAVKRRSLVPVLKFHQVTSSFVNACTLHKNRLYISAQDSGLISLTVSL